MPKPRQLKPWPDLSGLLPLLKAEEPRLRKNELGHIDFENVIAVDAIGLAIYLARLQQFVQCGRDPFLFTPPKSKAVQDRLHQIEFNLMLAKICSTRESEDLFTQVTSNSDYTGSSGADYHRQRVIRVSSTSERVREEEILRVKAEIKAFLSAESSDDFPREQIMVILLELVKNTLDHSGCAAYIGLSVDSESKFSFSYADSGPGITTSVRKYWHEKSKVLQENGVASDAIRYARLSEKASFADLIHWAIQGGNSTKLGNGVNFGFGLMMIVEAARNSKVRLAVRDADTYLNLSDFQFAGSNTATRQLSHTAIRQRCVTTSAAPLLLFHGEFSA